MAFGSKALLALCIGSAAYGAAFEARHDHWRGSCAGTLTIDESGVRYKSEKHTFRWSHEDIQRFDLGPDRLRILTYEDRIWLGGADREVEFRGPFEAALPLLNSRLVNRIANSDIEFTWSVPAKLTGRLRGSEGDLLFADNRIVYRTKAANQSRIWPFDDIEHISSSGRFDFTIATFERDFHFQLKQPLDQERYDRLWLRLQEHKGLKLIGEKQ